MSYHAKRTITNIISSLLVLGAYIIYALNQYQTGAAKPDDLKFWAVTMLVFIGIGIVAAIVIQIIFHILISVSVAVQQKIQDESCDEKQIDKSIKLEMVEDEMDKLIELKSGRASMIVSGGGFVVALISLLFNAAPVIMLNILFISFSLGSILEGFVQLYFHRKGIRHG